MESVNVSDPVRQQAADGTSDRCTGDEVAEADRQLPPSVEGCQVEDQAREHGSFCQSEQQAASDEAPVVLDQTRQGCYDAP